MCGQLSDQWVSRNLLLKRHWSSNQAQFPAARCLPFHAKNYSYFRWKAMQASLGMRRFQYLFSDKLVRLR